MSARWRFEVGIASKSDMAYHPDTERDFAKRRLGVKLSFKNEEGIEKDFWIMSQREARQLADRLSGTLGEISGLENHLDQKHD